ncbi:MAG: hypothetical protein Q8Q47_07505, partial [Ignavibacteriaceae bacterium]|nr:hypothetical protein [Ignavibacteriaceae bacterium]
NISSFGDTIYVGNGTYIEQVFMINGLSLIGSGWDSCIIDTRTLSYPQSFYSVTMKDSCTLEGFHIIVTNTTGGSGIKCWPEVNDPPYFHGEIKNNKVSISNNGIFTSDAFLTIKNNIIENVNYGIWVDATSTTVIDSIYNNYMLNIGNFGIITILSSKAIIFDNIIKVNQNVATAINSLGTSIVFNNILLNSSRGDYGFRGSTAPSEIRNNIAVNFNVGLAVLPMWNTRNNAAQNNSIGYKTGGEFPDAKYNNSWNNGTNYSGFTPDSTNLSVDPMFVNEDSLNFYLQMYSLLIDAGDPTILDKDGTRSDIGLFGGPYGEKYTYMDLAPKPPRNITGVYEEKQIVLKWNKNTEADFKYYRIYRDTISGFIYDSTKLVGSTTDTLFRENLPYRNSETKYYYLVTAIDSTENQSAPGEEVTITITGNAEFPPLVLEEYKLLNNYPNPFNPRTIIPYRLKEGGYVKLYIYDIKGEIVEVLVNGWQDKGYYEKEFDSRGKRSDGMPEWSTGYNNEIATGIYIYKLQVININNQPVFTGLGKMILLK